MMGALAKVRGGEVSQQSRSHEGQLRGSARKKLNRGVRRKETPEGFAEAQRLREEADRKMKAMVQGIKKTLPMW